MEHRSGLLHCVRKDGILMERQWRCIGKIQRGARDDVLFKKNKISLNLIRSIIRHFAPAELPPTYAKTVPQLKPQRLNHVPYLI